MRKTAVACTVAVLLSLVMTISANAKLSYDAQKEQAHQIAEIARSLGLPETDPIIVRAKELWQEAQDKRIFDQEILATVIFNEAGSNDCTIEHKELAAMVPLNRLAMGYGGAETLYDVVTRPGQYLPAYATPGSYYWNRAREDADTYAICYEIAGRALNGEIDCPSDVIYQANFPQASWGCTTRIYKQFWACGNWTYFCYAGDPK